MSPVAGRSARAASRSPPGPTTSPPCARWGRRMCSRRSPTRRRCSTRSSLDRFHPPGGARRRGAAGRRGAAPMNVPLKIPMPLRAPELAPSLGRLLVPRRPEPPWVPLDDVREELATRVLELAGEARAAAVREERERVLDAVSRRAWLTAWEHAVRRAAQRVAGALDAEIERAALGVREARDRGAALLGGRGLRRRARRARHRCDAGARRERARQSRARRLARGDPYRRAAPRSRLARPRGGSGRGAASLGRGDRGGRALAAPTVAAARAVDTAGRGTRVAGTGAGRLSARPGVARRAPGVLIA